MQMFPQWWREDRVEFSVKFSKTIKGINFKCLNDLFIVESNSYSFGKDFGRVQFKRRTTDPGLGIEPYFDANSWNDNLAFFVDTLDGHLRIVK